MPLNVPPNANRARDENCEISAVRTLRGHATGHAKGRVKGHVKGHATGRLSNTMFPILAETRYGVLPITLMRSKQKTQ